MIVLYTRPNKAASTRLAGEIYIEEVRLLPKYERFSLVFSKEGAKELPLKIIKVKHLIDLEPK